METYYTVYRITNKLNGKTYIGSHKTKKLDDGYMGSGKYLKRAIDKNGEENFEKKVLFVYDNPKEMFAKEAELVNEDYLTNENTYNLKLGGEGGFDHLNTDAGIEKRRWTFGVRSKAGTQKFKALFSDDSSFRSSQLGYLKAATIAAKEKNIRVSDEVLLEALNSYPTISKALKSVGLSSRGGARRRAERLRK